MKITLIFTIVIASIIGCSAQKKTAKSQTESIESVEKEFETSKVDYILQYKKTPCYGRCPVYDFELFEDKSCKINGKLFYKVEGEKIGRLTDEKFEYLKGLMTELNFYELQSVYDDTLLMDATTYYLSMNIDNNYKEVKCRVGVPENVKIFIKKLETLIDEVNWN